MSKIVTSQLTRKDVAQAMLLSLAAHPITLFLATWLGMTHGVLSANPLTTNHARVIVLREWRGKLYYIRSEEL